jgi:peptide chain release factor subunit 1
MLANDLDPARLRRLAGLKVADAIVLSFYVDLDPTTFAAPPARQSEVNSLLDDAERRLREAELEHAVKVAAREDLERAREALASIVTDAAGGRAVALFACGPAGLLELVRLPRPVASRFAYDSSPWIEPLVRMGADETICVALVDRNNARILHGTRDSLVELDDEVRELERALAERLADEPRRHARPTDADVHEHVKHLSRLLLEVQKTRGFDCLFVATPVELRGDVEAQLHPYVRERFGGWLDVPVEYASVDGVRRAAAAALDAERVRRDDDALARLRERLGRGERAAAGLAAVLAALNERRVEMLLYDDTLHVGGVVCPSCGFLGVDEATCPVDGTATERRDDIVENAAETAVLQSAQVRALHDRPELGPHGGIAATLRF